VNVPVRAQGETRRGADGLGSPSLILSYERHPVPGNRQVRCRRRAKLDHAAGRQVKVRYRTVTHRDKCEVRGDRRPDSRVARIEGRLSGPVRVRYSLAATGRVQVRLSRPLRGGVARSASLRLGMRPCQNTPALAIDAVPSLSRSDCSSSLHESRITRQAIFERAVLIVGQSSRQ